MHKEEVFAAWAPDDGLWSPWVKPVLFAHLSDDAPAGAPPSDPVCAAEWAPDASERCALVVDLPGATAAWCGPALANRGYQPIPLFNCAAGAKAVVPVEGIMAALVAASSALDTTLRRSEGPPAFLLDAGRLPRSVHPDPGQLDNRWMVFPQDFPSGNRLLHHDVRGAILVRQSDAAVPADLAHVLLRWQQAGVALESLIVQTADRAPLSVKRPPRFGGVAYALLAMAGLRRSSAGGFGGIVPTPSSGGMGGMG